MESPLPSSSGAPREGLGRVGVKLYRYRNLVLRQWWILALTIGVGLAYQGWVVSQKPRVYSSSSQIMIKDELSGGPDGLIKVNSVENFVGTNMTVMKSANVMDNARRSVSLNFPGLTGSVPEIAVSMIPKTQIFVVTGTGPDPEYTQAFVDALVQSFVDYRLGAMEQFRAGMGSGLEEKVKKMKADLAAAEERLRAYTTANKMPFWQEQYLSSLKTLSAHKNRQAALQAELTRLSTTAPDLLLIIPPAPSVPASAATSPGEGGATVDSGALSQTSELYNLYLLRSRELSAAQSALEEKSKIWKPKHPKFIALQDEVNRIQQSIEVVKKQNRESIAQRIEAYKSELLSLEATIATYEKKVEEASLKNDEFKALDGEKNRISQELSKLQGNATGINTILVNDVFSIIQKATPAVLVGK